MIKGLRRSMKGEKHNPSSQNLPNVPKTPTSLQPPKKIIKALYDYTAASEQELGFQKGDFFHVIANEDDPEWYEACNPATGARGMVPVPYFQSLDRQERDSASSARSDLTGGGDGYPYRPVSGNGSFADRGSHVRKSISTKIGGPLYGTVIYNFDAERPDELQAQAGEAIIVIAQSNDEWFLAKPIGRLGGPGLIPVSFIEIKDMATGLPVESPAEAIARAGVPKVEEWKKQAAEYKNSSIQLGKFSFGAIPIEEMNNLNVNGGGQRERPEAREDDYLAPVNASVDRYAFENGRYWYVLQAEMEDGRNWSLRRYYEDFYDFQIALIGAFPKEAGTYGDRRILPYMPGPVTYVTDTISSARRKSLDEYIKEIMAMGPAISRHRLVKKLFAPREGDVETSPEELSQGPQFPTQNRDSQLSHQSSDSSPAPSRQGSRVDLNGNTRNNSFPSVLSPPPAQRAAQGRMGPPAVPNVNGNQTKDNHLRQNSQSRIDRMDSTMNASTTASGGTATGSGATTNSAQTFMKVKVHYHDDIIAIRLPTDITLGQLQTRLEQRLEVQLTCLRYKDDPTGNFYDLISDGDLATAISRNTKLVLAVT